MIRWILDLVLLLIILLCGWRGFRNGFISGILAVCAVLFSFYAANLVAQSYSGEFTKMLEPFVSGITDSTVDDCSRELTAHGTAQLTEHELVYEALGKLGVMKSARELISEAYTYQYVDSTADLCDRLVEQLCGLVAYVLTYLIAFVLLIILFAVIGNLFNLAFKLPGLEVINGSLGAVFGLAKGIMYAFAIAWVLRFTGLLVSEETVDTTVLLSLLMEKCPLATYLGI